LSYFDNKLFSQIKKLALKGDTKAQESKIRKAPKHTLKENLNHKLPLYPWYIPENLIKQLGLNFQDEYPEVKWKRFSEFLKENSYIYEGAPPCLKLEIIGKGGAYEILHDLPRHYEHI
jgi:hypothetical protein